MHCSATVHLPGGGRFTGFEMPVVFYLIVNYIS